MNKDQEHQLEKTRRSVIDLLNESDEEFDDRKFMETYYKTKVVEYVHPRTGSKMLFQMNPGMNWRVFHRTGNRWEQLGYMGFDPFLSENDIGETLYNHYTGLDNLLARPPS